MTFPNENNRTTSPYASRIGVSPMAVRCMRRLRDALAGLPESDRGWWVDRLDGAQSSVACCPPGDILGDTTASLVSVLTVEGTRWSRSPDLLRVEIGMRAVVFGVACGLVRAVETHANET